jgi:signal transduction histidine kinase/ActR/RegA family two-component response regulator
VLKALGDDMFESDRRGRVLFFRSSQTGPWHDPLGTSPTGGSVLELWPADVSRPIIDAIAEAGQNGQSKRQTISVTRGGKTGWYELSVAAVGDLEDPRFVVLARDVTERKALEQQLVQSQKMEAIGRLAGGIAHDFNNILQVIIGFCELIRMTRGERREVDEYVNTIRDSARRAASLTQHLLAFSRKQMLAPKDVDVDELIEESLPMLARMVGENISIAHTTDGGPNLIRVDSGQYVQVITNLAVNARDAMPSGGKLEINVRRRQVAEADPARPPEMLPGDYVLIQVSDTGTGMDEETLSHLFEPFFTTKVLGRGTGMGLSIVYGVVKQSGGYIHAESTLGSGTTFSINLPRIPGEQENPKSCPEEEHHGTETILLVEDEDDVRRLIHQHLSACGYKVLQAGDGNTAVGICRRHASQVRLLLVDVVLPDIRGDRVSQEFRAVNPLGRVVFMTGYTDSTGFVESAQREDMAILQKPFTPSELAARIRQVLDQPQAP